MDNRTSARRLEMVLDIVSYTGKTPMMRVGELLSQPWLTEDLLVQGLDQIHVRLSSYSTLKEFNSPEGGAGDSRVTAAL